ncbi:hypothetical protein SAMD00019534_089840 [Acytostelium subglobosum LB1]|uniref:hypothetical protein n=1 Tax=Acytostelium subglobosum LB1 TaxID=1410327 RepID=UPI000644FD7D|nr:hypothetical protein SAMD00019534_089840 [Acytostelium subglobosum LB1]GAM25809.1 hypothetical protein SAMD00019534_089840 [Acytostelium subglobosum LB1]|eukprot:XP_012751327.1 hypothetical protein SAMD00019534_089840 [Acytostelium subglobosum LB1]
MSSSPPFDIDDVVFWSLYTGALVTLSAESSRFFVVKGAAFVVVVGANDFDFVVVVVVDALSVVVDGDL